MRQNQAPSEGLVETKTINLRPAYSLLGKRVGIFDVNDFMYHPAILSRRSPFLLKSPQEPTRVLFDLVITLFGVHQDCLHVASSQCSTDDWPYI